MESGKLNQFYLLTTITDYEGKTPSALGVDNPDALPAQITGLAKVYLQVNGYTNPFSDNNN